MPHSKMLCPSEIKGLLNIAAIRPDYLKIVKQNPDAPNRAGYLESVLRSLRCAIDNGNPEMFLADCSRDVLLELARKMNIAAAIVLYGPNINVKRSTLNV